MPISRTDSSRPLARLVAILCDEPSASHAVRQVIETLGIATMALTRQGRWPGVGEPWPDVVIIDADFCPGTLAAMLARRARTPSMAGATLGVIASAPSRDLVMTARAGGAGFVLLKPLVAMDIARRLGVAPADGNGMFTPACSSEGSSVDAPSRGEAFYI